MQARALDDQPGLFDGLEGADHVLLGRARPEDPGNRVMDRSGEVEQLPDPLRRLAQDDGPDDLAGVPVCGSR